VAAKKKTFEEQMEELESCIERLESGELGLDAALAEFEKGKKLLEACRALLARAEKKIEALTGVADGEAETEPFEAETGEA
jgi:exodeoxyribonuclease VII small subunit